MANGQPRPVFYVAIFVVVVGLIGLALWRFGAIGPGSGAGRFSTDELKQMAKGAEKPDSSGITTVKEYNYVPSARLPEVKGISNYQPMADRTVRFAINVWAGWARSFSPTTASRRARPGRRRAARTSRSSSCSSTTRSRCATPTPPARPHRLGHARHAAAHARGPAQGFARDAACLSAGGLVQRRRRHRRP